MNLDEVKTLIVVGDGMADEPVASLGGKTPLESAGTPNMDALARSGIVGLLRSVPEGMPPGSDIANMSLMGYDPAQYYTGRAPLEAASMGITMGERDLAFRCNLVTLQRKEDGQVMADYSGDGITTERASRVVRRLNERFETPDRTFHTGVAYRHLFLWKNGEERFRGLETTPPHDISGLPVSAHLPRGNGSEELNRLMEKAADLLAVPADTSDESSAGSGPNAIWFWGQGTASVMPSLYERFQIRGATVCAVDLIKGLGRCAGMDAIQVPGATGDIDTNFQGKALAALNALRDHDLVFLHVESPDEAAHRGDLEEKIRSIERFDHEVIGVLRKGLQRKGLKHRLLILPDHATPLRTRTHSDQPIPFLLHCEPSTLPVAPQLDQGRCAARGYHEREAEKSGIRIMQGHELLGLILNRIS